MFPDDLGCITRPRCGLSYRDTSFEPAADGDVAEIVRAVAFLDKASVMQLAHSFGEEALESQAVPGEYVVRFAGKIGQYFFCASV